MRAKKVANIRMLVADVIVWGLLCVLVVLGLVFAGDIRQYSSISLRFDLPISGRAAYAARQYSITHSKENTFWPTFWTEYKASFSSELVTADANCIAYSGDASLVWPAEYVSGAAPGVIDDSGCSVSEALACKLWGSTDVVGMAVEIDGAGRSVRGVFRGKEELAMISFRDEDATGNWHAVELDSGSGNATRDDAERYAIASGLGNPDIILMGNLSSLARLMMALPLLILAIYCLGLILDFVRKRYPTMRKLVPFLILFAFVALLPAMLGRFPEWLIPTRWSDFSFWDSLLAQASNGLREFLRAAPQSRDVVFRMQILRLTGVAVLAVCLSLTACLRWHIQGIRG